MCIRDRVYDGQASMAGVQREDTDAVLLPLFHTYLAAHITVTIDMQGHFLDARVLDVKKDEVYTIVPSTVDSSSRSGPEPPPNPFNDKLVYLMGDADSCLQDKQMAMDIQKRYRAHDQLLAAWSLKMCIRDRDYNTCIEEARQDQRKDARPGIVAMPDHPEQYDVIYLGYPKMQYGI